MKLTEALPELVADLETALAHLGRGDLIGQLHEATLQRWSYDDFSDTTYLQLTAEAVDMMNIERLSLYDEVGVNVDSDTRGRLCGLEVMDGKRVTSQLEKTA
jgi:uncharacterized protein YuzE